MNEHEFETYRTETHTPAVPTIHVDEVPGEDRTLVYGYSRTYDEQHNESTHTVHVYKANGMLHIVFYRGTTGEQVYAFSGTEVPAEDCRPYKRAYPERTDLDFARLMRERDVEMTFTTFDADRIRTDGPFYGSLIEETHRPASA